MILHRSLLALLAVLWLGASLAQDKPAAEVAAAQATVDCLRPIDKAGERLPGLLELARSAAARICSAKNPKPADVAPIVLEVVVASNQAFKAIGLDETIFPFDSQLAQARETADKSGAISPMRPLRGGAVGIWFYDEVPVRDEARCDEAVKHAPRDRVTATTCREFFQGYLTLYNYAQNAMQRRLLEPVQSYVARMRTDWDDFLSKSRSQTPLELYVNTRLWDRNEKKGVFLAPPSSQLILFHPSVAMERVGRAQDGQHTKEAVLVEVVGMNWWRRDDWKQVSGGSFVLLYSERAGAASWGPGFALHLGNKYTIGMTSHAGAKGVFVSLDVLELAKDRKLMGEKYSREVLDFLK